MATTREDWRERNNTHLTDLGQLVKPHLEQVLAATEAAQEQAVGFKSATKVPLKLGVMCTISPHVIVGFLRAIREKLPAVEPTIIERPGKQLLDDMMKGEMDVALLGMPNLPERLDPIPLYRERYGIAFPKGHRFEKLNAVPIEELNNEHYAQRTASEFNDHWKAMGIERDIPVNIVFRSDREDWIQAMLAAGLAARSYPNFCLGFRAWCCGCWSSRKFRARFRWPRLQAASSRLPRARWCNWPKTSNGM